MAGMLDRFVAQANALWRRKALRLYPLMLGMLDWFVVQAQCIAQTQSIASLPVNGWNVGSVCCADAKHCGDAKHCVSTR